MKRRALTILLIAIMMFLSINSQALAVSEEENEINIEEDSETTEVLLEEDFSEEAEISFQEQNGTIGDLKWEINSEGVLTISGKGAMKDFSDADRAPWLDYDFEKVVISSGVTSIGEMAFYMYAKLKKVEINSNVETIGYGAFYNCGYLSDINLPDSVVFIGADAFYMCDFAQFHFPLKLTTIGNFAFANCYALKEAIIPEKVTSIGDGAFSGCHDITKVSLPEGLTDLGYDAFDKCTGLKTVTLPGSLKNIGTYTFERCENLESVVINPGVESLPDNMFEKCASLSSVELPEGLIEIGSDCFSHCGSLENLSIPSTVTTLGARIVKYCYQLKTIELPKGLKYINFETFSSCGITSMVIPDSMEGIPAYAFLSCGNLTTLYIPNTIAVIGNYAFMGCASITDVYFSGSEDEWNAIEIGTDNEALTDANIHFYCRASSKCGENAEWDFADGVLTISGSGDMYDYVFDDGENAEVTIPWWDVHTKIKKVVVKQGITSIGSCSFIYHTELTEIHIPKSVKKVRPSAFYNSFLKDVYYKGTEENWAKISIGKENDPLKAATKHFSSSENGNAKLWKTFTSKTNSIYDKDMAYKLGELSQESEDTSNEKIRNAYYNLGLENIMTGSKSGTGNYSGDYAYAIGSIDIGEDNVIVITARGSTNSSEFIYDGTTGITKGNFFGYNTVDISYKFEEVIWKALNAYLDKYPYLESGEQGLKIVVCGHSLGGAAANLVAARLDILLDRGEFLSSIMTSSDVYAYTFGSIDAISKYYYEVDPLTGDPIKKSSNYSVPVESCFENIHNIYNMNDSFAPYAFKVQVINAAGALLDVETGNAFSMYGKFGHMHLFGHDYGSEFGLDTPNHNMPAYLSAVENSLVPQCAAVDYDVHGVVACPVNVFVLKDGEVVGEISNNVVVKESPGITLFVNNYDVKHFFLPKGDYDVRIVSYGDTKMSCFLEDGKGSDQNYDNVDLSWGKSFLFKDVNPVSASKKAQLYVLNEEGDIEKKVMPDGEEKDISEGGEEDPDSYGDILPQDLPESGIIPDGIWVSGIKDMLYSGITLKPDIRVYDGKNLLIAKKDYTISYKNNKKAYEIADKETLSEIDKKQAPRIVIKMKGNYSGSKTLYFSILPPSSIEPTETSLQTVPMNKVNVDSIPVQVYNGEKITIDDLKDGDKAYKLNVSYQNKKLVEGSDFEVLTISHCLNAGTATITLRGLLASASETGFTFSGTKNVSFKIVPRRVDASGITVNNSLSIETSYKKGGAAPKISVKDGDRKLKEGLDYTVKYSNNTKPAKDTDAKAPQVVIAGKGNYTGKKIVKYTITKAPFSDNVTILAFDKAESNKAGQYSTKVKVLDSNGKALKAGADYEKNVRYYYDSLGENEVAKTDRPLSGTTIYAAVTGRGIYSDETIFTPFRIISPGKDISKGKFKIKDQPYIGSSITITDASQFSVSSLGSEQLVLNAEDGFEVVEGTYQKNMFKGTAKVTLHGTGIYGGYKTVTFKVGTRSLSEWWKGLF